MGQQRSEDSLRAVSIFALLILVISYAAADLEGTLLAGRFLKHERSGEEDPLQPCGAYPPSAVFSSNQAFEILEIRNTTSKDVLPTTREEDSFRHFIPRSIIHVEGSAQNFTLLTGVSRGYFTHGIRGKQETQLMVEASSPEVLLRALTDTPARFIQLHRAYWNTFSRVIITFSKPEVLDGGKTKTDLLNQLATKMDSYNVVIHGLFSGQGNSTCSTIHICYQCCEEGRTCQVKIDPNDVATAMDPDRTAFKGNLNKKRLVTAATNAFRTYYPSGKLDKDGNIIYTGIEVDVLNMFAQVMNFTYAWSYPEPTATWGSLLPNGSWTALIGRLARKELDISVATLSMVYERSMVMDFSFPYDYDGTHILEAAPIIEYPGLTVITSPFTITVWLVVMSFFVIISGTLFIMIHISAKFDQAVERWANKENLLIEIMMYVFSSFTRQHSDHGFDFTVPDNSVRIVLGTWSMLGMILTTIYLTMQFGVFFDVSYTPVVDTAMDYITAPKNIVILGSAAEALHARMGIGLRTIVVTPKEQAEIYLPKILKDRNLVLGTWRNIVRNWLFNYPSVTTDMFNPRNFRMSRESPIPFYTSVGLQKRSPYTKKVSEICIRLQETGLVKYLNNYYAIKIGMQDATFKAMSYDPKIRAMKERPLIPLTLFGHLGGSFLILFIGFGLGAIAFVWEHIKARRSRL